MNPAPIRYTICYNSFSSIFAVPTQAVRRCLSTCPENALRVLLLVLSDPSQPISPQVLAGELGISAQEAEQALRYWAQEGVLRAEVDLSQPSAAQTAQTADLSQAAAPEAPSPKPASRSVRRAGMDIRELDALSLRDCNIRAIVQEAQERMGRPLSRTETERLVSYYTCDGLAPEFLSLVIVYCISVLHKPSINYICRVLDNMLAQEVDTYEKAERYLDQQMRRSSNEGQVMAAFGIRDRALTRQEKEAIQTWFGPYGFDIAMVRLAYERCIDQTQKLSFPYIGSILKDWHAKGIRTPKDAAAEAAARSKEAPSPARAPAASGQFAASSIDEEMQRFLMQGSCPRR